MGAKICVLLNCGQQSQFSKVRREFDAGRVNLDPPMTCADWPVPGNLTLLHPQTAYTRKPLHRVEPRLHRHESEEVSTLAVAIAHVFAVPAQCQAHHGECHVNVYCPKQTHTPKGRFCHACLFLDAINALTRLPLPECDACIKVRLGFLV